MSDISCGQSSMSASAVACFKQMMIARLKMMSTIDRCRCSISDGSTTMMLVIGNGHRFDKKHLAKLLEKRKLLRGKGVLQVCWDLLSGGSELVGEDELNRNLWCWGGLSVRRDGQLVRDSSEDPVDQRQIEVEFDSVPTFQGNSVESEKEDTKTTEVLNFFSSIRDDLLNFEKLRIKFYDTPGFSLYEFHRVLTMFSPHDTVLKSILEVQHLPAILSQFIGLEEGSLSYKKLRRAITPVCQSIADLYGSAEGYFDLDQQKYVYSLGFIDACGEISLSGSPLKKSSPSKNSPNEIKVPHILGFDEQVPTELGDPVQKTATDRSLDFPFPKQSFNHLRRNQPQQTVTHRRYRDNPVNSESKVDQRRPMTVREYPRTELKTRLLDYPKLTTDGNFRNRSNLDLLSNSNREGGHRNYFSEQKTKRLIEPKYRSTANLDANPNRPHIPTESSMKRVFSGYISANGGRVNSAVPSDPPGLGPTPLRAGLRVDSVRLMPSVNFNNAKRSLIRY